MALRIKGKAITVWHQQHHYNISILYAPGLGSKTAITNTVRHMKTFTFLMLHNESKTRLNDFRNNQQQYINTNELSLNSEHGRLQLLRSRNQLKAAVKMHKTTCVYVVENYHDATLIKKMIVTKYVDERY